MAKTKDKEPVAPPLAPVEQAAEDLGAARMVLSAMVADTSADKDALHKQHYIVAELEEKFKEAKAANPTV